jgi:hypothetical protein
VRQLTILSGAGINHGIAQVCPQDSEMANLTYQKISESVYERVSTEIRAMFSRDSFDYILGGLLTINLAIEKTKQDLKRFNMDERAFSDLFKQSTLQTSIIDALNEIEKKLTISLDQMIHVVETFDTAIEKLLKKYDSINYFTLNFDGIFDHIIYGPNYSRAKSKKVTDFWRPEGLNQSADANIKIFHLHGDLRYKPFKKMKGNTPLYNWPVLVVGDQQVKKGIIASNEALRFYNNCLSKVTEERAGFDQNNLALIGLGFRDEDKHIVDKIKHGISKNIFDDVSLYNPENQLSPITQRHQWIRPSEKNLLQFFESL